MKRKKETPQVTDEQEAQALKGLLAYFNKKSHTPEDHRQAKAWTKLVETYVRQRQKEVADLRLRVSAVKALQRARKLSK